MRRMCIAAITLFCILGLHNMARAECGIEILGASPYGSRPGTVWGKVTGVANTSSFKVLTIIKVGDGWWVKPACNQPFTVIKADGTWQTDITTGGTDQFAEYILVKDEFLHFTEDWIPA